MIKILSVFLLIGLASCSLVEREDCQEHEKEWQLYKLKYHDKLERFYKEEGSDKIRRKIFMEKLIELIKHNKKKGVKYLKEINHFFHLTYEEMKKMVLMNENTVSPESSEKAHQLALKKKKRLEENILLSGKNRNKTKKKKDTRLNQVSSVEVDWTAAGCDSPVYEQGLCGSCYAFAATQVIENQLAIILGCDRFKTEAFPLFSQQHLVDCTFKETKDKNGISYGNEGCGGGDISQTLAYYKHNGCVPRPLYPYISSRHVESYVQECRHNVNQVYKGLKVPKINFVAFGDANGMRRALKKGILAGYIFVTQSLFTYKKGIYTGEDCKNNPEIAADCSNVNHAIVITGYGTENGIPYWKVKNTWGTQFGENGYFRIRAHVNLCCIEAYSLYPTVTLNK